MAKLNKLCASEKYPVYSNRGKYILFFDYSESNKMKFTQTGQCVLLHLNYGLTHARFFIFLDPLVVQRPDAHVLGQDGFDFVLSGLSFFHRQQHATHQVLYLSLWGGGGQRYLAERNTDRLLSKYYLKPALSNFMAFEYQFRNILDD